MEADRDDSIAPDDNGPVSGLFTSLSNLFATLLGIAQTRIELFTTELQSDVQHSAEIVIWTVVAMLAASMGIFSAALLFIFLLWDSHRIIASIAVITVFFAIAVVAALVARAKMRGKPRLLEATLAELSEDRARLSRRRRG